MPEEFFFPIFFLEQISERQASQSDVQEQNPAKFGLARANPAKSSKVPARSGLAEPIPGVRRPIRAISDEGLGGEQDRTGDRGPGVKSDRGTGRPERSDWAEDGRPRAIGDSDLFRAFGHDDGAQEIDTGMGDRG
jgi:hypothetical protein